ncbi:unnamed protein product [Caretta caretta]
MKGVTVCQEDKTEVCVQQREKRVSSWKRTAVVRDTGELQEVPKYSAGREPSTLGIVVDERTWMLSGELSEAAGKEESEGDPAQCTQLEGMKRTAHHQRCPPIRSDVSSTWGQMEWNKEKGYNSRFWRKCT